MAMCLASAVAHAQDTGAVSSGNWETPSVWTTDSVPDSSNDVYIGSDTPSGAAMSATITLTADESADNLYLGYDFLDIGTLDLGGNTLTIGNSLEIGLTGGSGTINEGGGSFTAGSMFLESANSYTFGSSDQVASLDVVGASDATTSAVDNVTDSALINNQSTLNLGANLALSGNLDVENTGTTLNMNGNDITAGSIYLGWNQQQAVTLNRGTTPGWLAASNLYVYGATFNPLASDSITNFYLDDGSTTLNSGVAVSSLTLENGSGGLTSTTGNITGNVNVLSDSTFNLGANLNLGGILDVENTGSVVFLESHNLAANTIYLGWNDQQAVTVNYGPPGDRGSLTATNLYVYGGNGTGGGGGPAGNYNLMPTDSITNFYLDDASTTFNTGVAVSNLTLENGASGDTTTTGNITGNVTALSDSGLYLQANLTLTGNLDVENTRSVVFLEGNNLTANSIYLGWNDQQAVTVNYGSPTDRGSLTATNLYVYGGNGSGGGGGAPGSYGLMPTDSITNFYLDDAGTTLNTGVAVSSLTLENGSNGLTTTSANITGNVSVLSNSTFNLGANLTLSGNIDVENAGSAVNGNNFNLSAGDLTAGYTDPGAVNVTGIGTINLNHLYIGNGSTMRIEGGTVNDLISLTGNSELAVDQTGGSGLTLDGTSVSDLTIDPSSMDLIFNSSGWDFRWQDPTLGGNWISTIDAMIASGQIVVTSPTTYSVIDQNGYTYIADGAVPEPASATLIGIACIGLALTRPRRRLYAL
jgi:hypothetical protein